MGIFFAFWRRFFGGFDSKFNILEYRGIQMIFCVLVTFAWEYFIKHKPWYISLIIAVLVYIYWCCGHWWWFKCSTEDRKYIEEEMAKGRKPALHWLVKPICKFFGFTDENSTQYCFIGMLVRYTLYAVPVACFVGWKFYAAGFAIPFVYNACFWINFPKWRFADSPTNWAELFSGLIIGWALV